MRTILLNDVSEQYEFLKSFHQSVLQRYNSFGEYTDDVQLHTLRLFSEVEGPFTLKFVTKLIFAKWFHSVIFPKENLFLPIEVPRMSSISFVQDSSFLLIHTCYLPFVHFVTLKHFASVISFIIYCHSQLRALTGHALNCSPLQSHTCSRRTQEARCQTAITPQVIISPSRYLFFSLDFIHQFHDVGGYLVFSTMRRLSSNYDKLADFQKLAQILLGKENKSIDLLF